MTESDEDADAAVPMAGRRCPVCGKPAVYRVRPFCSRRCADLDLGRWLKGDYRIATDDEAGPGDDPESEDV